MELIKGYLINLPKSGGALQNHTSDILIERLQLVQTPFLIKGHLISKKNCQAEDSPKKRTNEFVFTTVRSVFVKFLGLIGLLLKLTDL